MEKNKNLVITIDGIDFVGNDDKGNAKKLADYIFQNERDIALNYSKGTADELYLVRYEFEKKFKCLPKEFFDLCEIVYSALDIVEKNEFFWRRKAGKYFNVYNENWFANAKYFGFFMDMDAKAQTSAVNCESYSRAKEDLMMLSMDVYKNQNKEIFDQPFSEEVYMQLMNYYKEIEEDNDDSENPSM